jgi:hypothetical protein
MFGPFAWPGFGMTPEMEKKQREREKQRREDRCKEAVPWEPGHKWQERLTLTAASWPAWRLFEVEPTKHNDVRLEGKPEGKFETSPSGKFMYCEKRLPRAGLLRTLQGSRKGNVMFDGAVNIPALHEKRHDGSWDERPWMSHTPMEVMTQRPGVRRARGHTVVAGLGLGWNLVQVTTKKTVKEVTLVEISDELTDWILPKVFAFALPDAEQVDARKWTWHGKTVNVVIGDAREVLATYTADVALIDIDESYGSNTFYVRGNHERFANGQPKNIPVVWVWGSAEVSDDGLF